MSQDDELTTVQDVEQEEELESHSAKEEVFKSLLEKSPEIVDKINALTTQEHPCLVIDYDYLLGNSEISDKYFMLNSPEFVKNVKRLGGAALEIYKEYHNNETLEFETRVRISDPMLARPLRTISAKNVNKGVVVSTATINSISKNTTTMTEPWGICYNCNQESEFTGSRKCPNCGERDFVMKPALSKITDFQFLEVQEMSNNSGAVPISYTLKLYGPDLVLKFQPGDNISFSGVVKLEKTSGPPQQQYSQEEEFSQDIIYEMVIEALYVEKIFKQGNDKDKDKLSKKDIDYIRRLRADNTDRSLTELLLSSFASHIYDEDLVKESLLIQLASTNMLHLLLVGSPSTGKSQMAKFAVKVSPIGMFSAGKGSSGVGLTASTIPDKSGVMKLSVGPVVLCHKGLVGVDELDKLTDDHKYYLLESMEEGTITVNKGGINAVLNAKTSIISIANPIGGHYDLYKNLVDNVKIPVPLLTRFDLIFVLKDIPEQERDTKIVKHIGKIFSRITKEENDPQLQQELEFLRKYFKYVQTVLPPTQDITEEVTALMDTYYPKLRQSGVDTNTTTITPRQVYGLYTIAVARSRMLLKTNVEKQDMERAIEIMNDVMKTSGTDVLTGQVDVGLMYKTPLKKLSDKLKVMEVINTLTKSGSEPVPRGLIIESLVKDAGLPEFKAEDLFRKFYDEGMVLEPRAGYFILNRD